MVDAASLDPALSLLRVGDTAPNFHLRDSAGKVYSLASQRGHPVLLEYFAVWCPVCHRETSVMTRLVNAYGGKGLTTWAILANPYGQNYELSRRTDRQIASRHDLSWYADMYNANYPLLIDPAFETVNRYGAASYPTIYLVDAAGRVAHARSGFQPYSEIASRLSSLVRRAAK